MRQLRELRATAEEYAETGGDFPVFGAGSLFTFLDNLARLVAAHVDGDPE